MKKRIGTLNNKRIIIGDENLVTKDEILLTKKNNSIELSVRDNDKMKVISGEGNISGAYFNLEYLFGSSGSITAEITVVNGYTIYPVPPEYLLDVALLPKKDPLEIILPKDYTNYNVVGANPYIIAVNHPEFSDSIKRGQCYNTIRANKVYKGSLYMDNSIDQIEIEEIEFTIDDGMPFPVKITETEQCIYFGVDKANTILFILSLGRVAPYGTVSLLTLFELLKDSGFNVDYSNFRALAQ